MKSLIVWISVALLLGGCSSRDTIVVASKNFSEQVILGELVSQHIENTLGLHVVRKLNLGGTFVCHEAMLAGDVDVYVEYTGTALTAILKLEPEGNPKEVFDRVQKLYREQMNLEWTEPFGFDNTFAMIIRGEDARKLGLKTISESARYTPQWRAGFGYEFMERKDGFPGLSETYGLKFAEPPRIMDLALTYRACADKQVDFIAGNSTDGVIDKLDLVVLEDDRSYFPPYEAAPVVRARILEVHPQLRNALDELGGKISAEEMRRMNYQVDVERADVKKVAAEFLESKFGSEGNRNTK